MTDTSPTEAQLAALRKGAAHHKYDHGHVLVMSGPRFQTGAARLSAQAALRIGAGLVTMGATERTLPELAAHLSEIMLTQIETGAALTATLSADARINALCLGPGLSVDQHGRDLVSNALLSGRSCVLDADALTLLAREPRLMADVHDGCVLTPHADEFKRLFPTLDPIKDRAGAVKAAAKLAGCTVLLKGSETVIADPSGATGKCDSTASSAAAWLATAGAGDVLSGFVAGLLARGMGPLPAAELAAHLHVLAAEHVGPGLIAGDLPCAIPHVFRSLGL